MRQTLFGYLSENLQSVDAVFNELHDKVLLGYSVDSDRTIPSIEKHRDQELKTHVQELFLECVSLLVIVSGNSRDCMANRPSEWASVLSAIKELTFNFHQSLNELCHKFLQKISHIDQTRSLLELFGLRLKMQEPMTENLVPRQTPPQAPETHLDQPQPQADPIQLANPTIQNPTEPNPQPSTINPHPISHRDAHQPAHISGALHDDESPGVPCNSRDSPRVVPLRCLPLVHIRSATSNDAASMLDVSSNQEINQILENQKTRNEKSGSSGTIQDSPDQKLRMDFFQIEKPLLDLDLRKKALKNLAKKNSSREEGMIEEKTGVRLAREREKIEKAKIQNKIATKKWRERKKAEKAEQERALKEKEQKDIVQNSNPVNDFFTGLAKNFGNLSIPLQSSDAQFRLAPPCDPESPLIQNQLLRVESSNVNGRDRTSNKLFPWMDISAERQPEPCKLDRHHVGQRERSRSQEKLRNLNQTETMNELLNGSNLTGNIDQASLAQRIQRRRSEDDAVSQVSERNQDRSNEGSVANNSAFGQRNERQQRAPRQRRVKRGVNEDDYVEEGLFLDGLPKTVKINKLSHGPLPFPDDFSEIEKIIHLEGDQYILSSPVSFTFYNEKDSENFRTFPNSIIGGKAISLNIYKDIGIWLVDKSITKLKSLFFQKMDIDGRPLYNLTFQTNEEESIIKIIMDGGSIFCMTDSDILVFDMDLYIEQISDLKLQGSSFNPSFKIENKGFTDMCFKDKCLYLVGNRLNSIVKVDLEKAYTGKIENLNDAITESKLINSSSPNLTYIKDIQVTPVEDGILVSTASKVYLLNSCLKVTGEYKTKDTIEVTKFTRDGRDFLLILQKRINLTLLAIFKGNLYEVVHLLPIDSLKTPFYGILTMDINCFLVYGHDNYQNWFAIDFSQHDLAHFYANQ